MRTLLFVLALFLFSLHACNAQNGASIVSSHGYNNCIQIKNKTTRVVIDPNAGGRVLVYELNWIDVIQQDPSHNGWTTEVSPMPEGHLCGGRFDIGPPFVKPNSDLFFFGSWTAEIKGQYSALLTSQLDKNSGLQLTREFILDPLSTQLTVKQTIFNKGEKAIRVGHWSRTFAEGDGICFMPIDEPSRFPSKYVVYGPGLPMDFRPVEPEVEYTDGYLIMYAPPTRPKFVMDVSIDGWIGYLTKQSRLFVKKFPVYNNKVYGEMTATNTSIWYNETRMVEIEPMSPWEWIEPGKSNSFTEDWFLYEYKFPKNRRDFNAANIKEIENRFIKQ
jgi:hypothetical protein